MAHNRITETSPPRNQRLFHSLVTYIRKKNYTSKDYPANDPVLKIKEQQEVDEAFEFIEMQAMARSPIEEFYQKENKGVPFVTGLDRIKISPAWKPLEDLAYQPERALWQMRGRTLVVLTPLEIFKVITHQVTLCRSTRVFYGIQSLMTKKPARYFMAVCENMTSRRSLQSWKLGEIEPNEEYKKHCPDSFSENGSVNRDTKIFLNDTQMLPPRIPVAKNQESFHEFIIRTIRSGYQEGFIPTNFLPRILVSPLEPQRTATQVRAAMPHEPVITPVNYTLIPQEVPEAPEADASDPPSHHLGNDDDSQMLDNLFGASQNLTPARPIPPEPPEEPEQRAFDEQMERNREEGHHPHASTLYPDVFTPSNS